MPSPNTGEDRRTRSSSAYRASARSIAAQSGTSDGSASSGFAYDHLSRLSASGGRPAPNPLPWAQSQRIWLNQSPELYELRSSDFERSRSEPVVTNPAPCPSAVVASASTCIRARSCAEVPCGSLYASASYRISLSCAST